MSDFDIAFEHIIGHEGGYVNNPNDPGGETKYGISKRSYPHEDIKNLTLARAKFLYKRDFWNVIYGDEWPFAIAEPLFDAAVNSGPTRAIKWMQMAVGTPADGIIGPETRASVAQIQPPVVAARMMGHRLDYMNSLGSWRHFSKGWAQRIAEILIAFPNGQTPAEPPQDRLYEQWLADLAAVLRRAPAARI